MYGIKFVLIWSYHLWYLARLQIPPVIPWEWDQVLCPYVAPSSNDNTIFQRQLRIFHEQLSWNKFPMKSAKTVLIKIEIDWRNGDK